MATKQFLDYAGLGTLWGIINSTFATKTELDNVKKVAIGSFDESAEASKITITAKSVSGEAVDTIVLGSASTTAAGLMSSADKSTLESLKETIDANTDFKGLQINGAAIATTAQANLKIEYDSDKKELKLFDANNTNAVSTVDASAFVKDGMLDSVEVVEKDGKQVLRFTWNTDANKDVKDITDVDLDKIITPYTAGEGITISDNTVSLNKAASDKLGGIKIGYTANDKNYAVELDTDGKAYVAVPWTDTTYSTGAAQGTYVKVSVDGTSVNSDDSALVTALETLNTTKVATASGDTYVNAKVEGTEVKVSATTALTNAVAAANSAVQTVAQGTGIAVTTDGTTATVALSEATIASLGKADAAVKSVSAEGTLIAAAISDNAVSLTVTDKLTNAVAAAESAVQVVAEGDGIVVTKNSTTSTVALNETTKASLAKADSAIQGVKIGTATASIGDDKVAVFEADAVATALGFVALTDAEIYAACGLTYPTPKA